MAHKHHRLSPEQAEALARSTGFQQYMQRLVVSEVIMQLFKWLQDKPGRRVVAEYAGDGNFDFEFFQDGVVVEEPFG